MKLKWTQTSIFIHIRVTLRNAQSTRFPKGGLEFKTHYRRPVTSYLFTWIPQQYQILKLVQIHFILGYSLDISVWWPTVSRPNTPVIQYAHCRINRSAIVTASLSRIAIKHHDSEHAVPSVFSASIVSKPQPLNTQFLNQFLPFFIKIRNYQKSYSFRDLRINWLVLGFQF
jgi:hypothetical protein